MKKKVDTKSIFAVVALLCFVALFFSYMFGYKKFEERANSLEIEYLKNEHKEMQELYGVDTQDQIRDTLWEKIKEVNQTIPHYKRVTDLYLTEEPFIKTTSLKIKRKEQLKKVLG